MNKLIDLNNKKYTTWKVERKECFKNMILLSVEQKYWFNGKLEIDLGKEIIFFQTEKNDKLLYIENYGSCIGMSICSGGGVINVFETNCHINGTGKIIATGENDIDYLNVIDVALSVVKKYCKFINSSQLDICVNAVGVYKNVGSSCGVSILLALISSLSKKKTYFDVATTGCITLNGDILPVGSICEKIIGGFKCGIKKFVVPLGNKNEIDKWFNEINNYVKKRHSSVGTINPIYNFIKIEYVSNIEQAIKICFGSEINLENIGVIQ